MCCGSNVYRMDSTRQCIQVQFAVPSSSAFVSRAGGAAKLPRYVAKLAVENAVVSCVGKEGFSGSEKGA